MKRFAAIVFLVAVSLSSGCADFLVPYLDDRYKPVSEFQGPERAILEEMGEWDRIEAHIEFYGLFENSSDLKGDCALKEARGCAYFENGAGIMQIVTSDLPHDFVTKALGIAPPAVHEGSHTEDGPDKIGTQESEDKARQKELSFVMRYIKKHPEVIRKAAPDVSLDGSHLSYYPLYLMNGIIFETDDGKKIMVEVVRPIVGYATEKVERESVPVPKEMLRTGSFSISLFMRLDGEIIATQPRKFVF